MFESKNWIKTRADSQYRSNKQELTVFSLNKSIFLLFIPLYQTMLSFLEFSSFGKCSCVSKELEQSSICYHHRILLAHTANITTLLLELFFSKSTCTANKLIYVELLSTFTANYFYEVLFLLYFSMAIITANWLSLRSLQTSTGY